MDSPWNRSTVACPSKCRQLLSVACESCPCAFDAVGDFNLDGVFEEEELAEVLDVPFWWLDLDVHPLHCHHVVMSGIRRRVGDEFCFRGVYL